MKKLIRLTEQDLHRIIKESLDKIMKWFNGSKVVDENGKPILLYHAYESDGFGGSYDSGMVFYTDDYDYACEFGDTIDKGYLKLTNPYIAEDGILKREDGSPIIDEDGYEMSVGYLDSISEEDLEYFMDNFDGIISENGFMVVSFIDNNFYKIS